jgi:DNA-binding NarL/FixJ family response regulator
MVPSTTNSKKVALIGREDLLAISVELFLSNQKDWEVIRISDQLTHDEVLEKVEEANPDVLILYQGDYASTDELPTQLLHICPKAKVITVSLENNSMDVYTKQEVRVKEVADLLSVVEQE